jgi:signal transduction histidine kinase
MLASVAIVIAAIFITSGVFVIRNREQQRVETLQKIASATEGFSISNSSFDVSASPHVQSVSVSIDHVGEPGTLVPGGPPLLSSIEGGSDLLPGDDGSFKPAGQAMTVQARELASIPDYRILLINKEGEVVQDPTGNLAGVKLTYPLDEAAGVPNKKGYVTWAGSAGSATSGLTFLAPTSLRSANADGLMAVAAIDSRSLTADWLAMGPELALSALVLLPLAVLAVVVVTRRITLPLRSLTFAVEGMSRGDFDQRVEVRGRDEVATLASSFTVMAGRVKERDTQLRALIANVSHDLRTPLTSIQGYAEALADGVTKPADVERAAGIIRDEARHASSLLANLLGLSEIESGEVVVRQEPYHLQEIVERCIRRLEPRAHEHGVEFHLQATDLPELLGDAEKVDRAVCNLVENAVKFADVRIDVRLARDGDQAAFSIANDGPPIDEADAGRIFDRFYRKAGPNAGTGLGLAIARELVELNGGTLSLRKRAPVEFLLSLSLP